MKKFILAAAAASLLATPAFAAQRHGDNNRIEQTRTVKHGPNRTVTVQRTVERHDSNRSWRKGERFDARYARNYRQIDYRQYNGRHLYAPPRGYHWVQSGNDAVLVGLTTGVIAAVLAGALN
ncbi:RcnB family protein [Stakelama sp. CBK3Z-3]|uniref:RcnB family protein n=1 Tax=Stakelama flava TaxID=2860338 RepID=A0ABS6XPE4_9SPHN|nr:RcnB family protein [Stakelama flava]MBW4332095.1 RcnB family protein [Stakelama flava]